MLKSEIKKVVDWNSIQRDDYLMAMERSPIKDTEIKLLLKNALSDEINSPDVFMKGIAAVPERYQTDNRDCMFHTAFRCRCNRADVLYRNYLKYYFHVRTDAWHWYACGQLNCCH
jgi:hypothetical protein